MKHAFLAFSAVLLAGLFPSTLTAAAVRPAGTIMTIVENDFSDLILAERQIQKSQTEIEKARHQLERDVLNQNNRDSFQNVIVKNEGIIAAYRGEALDDAEFLRAHLQDLTSTQKDALAQTWIDLQEGPSTF